MKKICLLISLLLILSLAACSGSDKTAGKNEGASGQGAEAGTDQSAGTNGTQKAAAGSFTWSREGYFSDKNGNFLSILLSEEKDYPGWYVGCMVDEGMYGWYIPQEGRTLHGSLVAPDFDEEPFVVTVSEEGENGLLFEIENGKAYHFKPYDVPEAAFALIAGVEGFGQIAYAEGENTPEFDDDYSSHSAYIGIQNTETYTFAAKPDEGWEFKKWTINDADYSTQPQITIEVSRNTDLIAVFGAVGSNEDHIDLEQAATLGELFEFTNLGTAFGEGECVYAFEQDEMTYRAVAFLPDDVAAAVRELNLEDEQYDEKLKELISPLKIERIENLTEGIPSPQEVEALEGKTGEELLSEGWYINGWNLDGMEFYMGHGVYSYIMIFEGEVTKAPEEFEEEDIRPLVVKSASFNGIGDPAALQN